MEAFQEELGQEAVAKGAALRRRRGSAAVGFGA
jgi:hypothetical protein